MNDLVREYAKVSKIINGYKRGNGFERLLLKLFEANGFTVHHNPKAAHPRQTDLMVETDRTILLIEAKCRKSKIGAPDIANLRDRLRRVPVDVIGAMLSTSDYTSSAIREVAADTTREILLFSREEIDQALCNRLNLHEIIRMKRNQLRIHRIVRFYKRDVNVKRSPKLKDCHDLLRMGSACVGTIRCNSRGSEILFARDIPDTKWAGVGGPTVVLTLELMLRDCGDLERLIAKIDQLFGLSNHGSYGIHQTSTSWFGFGAAKFIREVAGWEGRYAHARLKKIHHTEDIAYFDRFREGWVIVSAGHHICREPDSCFLSGECTIQLSGVPVDMTPYACLCRETNNADARFVHVVTPDFYSVRLAQEHRLKVKGEVVSNHSDDCPTVTGLIVENPFFNTSELPKELLSRDVRCPFRYMTEVQYLICYLADWHDYGDVVDYYFLRNMEACWAGGTIVLRPICTWHKILKRIVTKDQMLDRFKKVIERELAE
jgi:hypothetical protein